MADAPTPPAEVARFHSWIVRKEVPGGFFTSCRYNSPTPCTAEDVAKAPSVVRWVGNDTISKIYHPEW